MIYVDAPPVENENEATKLMIYHLQLAALYFEATYDDHGLFANQSLKGLPEQTINASSAFIEVLCSYYERLDL